MSLPPPDVIAEWHDEEGVLGCRVIAYRCFGGGYGCEIEPLDVEVLALRFGVDWRERWPTIVQQVEDVVARRLQGQA
jgi:hypothetical protein